MTRQQQQVLMGALLFHGPGIFEADDLATDMNHLPASSVRSRVRELCRAGYLRQSVVRSRRPSGRTAAMYHVADSVQRQVARLRPGAK